MMIFLIEIICLAVASFFAGMETGLLAADKLKIYSDKERGKSWAAAAEFLLTKPERLLGTTLVGTNIAVVTSAVVLNNYLRNNFSGTLAAAGSLLLTITFLLFSEIIPKTFFRRYAETITVKLAGVMLVFFYVFLPASFILNLFVKFIMILLRQKKLDEKLPSSKDDFRLLLHLSSRESGFGYDDFRAIDDILDFSTTLSSEAMIPIHKYPVLHINTEPILAIRTAEKVNQRYFPCYINRTDNIIGYIDIQDFFIAGNESIGSIIREPVFFPEVKPLPDLLNTMIEKKLEVIFLCDEYGGISGLLTHQQISSEIIGSIPGDLHTVREDVILIGRREYLAAGNVDIEYFSHVVGIKLKKGTNETLAGYLCEKTGKIPEVGTVFREEQVKYTILEGDKKTVSSIKVELISDDSI